MVLFLSPALEVLAQTPETDAYLRTLLPPDADQRPIPAGAYNVAAQLLAVEAGVVEPPGPRARVRLVGGVWLTFRAAGVDSSAPVAERDIAVTIEPTTPAERRMLYARSHAPAAPRERSCSTCSSRERTPRPSPRRCSSRSTRCRTT